MFFCLIIIEKFAKIKIIKNNEVIKILTEKKNVIGVITKNNQIINSEIIVCNADPPFVYKHLLDKKQNNFLFETKIKRMDYSMGLFVYYFGSKKKYNNIQHHSIYFGDSYKELLNEIAKRSGNQELATALKDKEALNAYLWGRDTLDLLLQNPTATFTADEFISLLIQEQILLKKISKR